VTSFNVTGHARPQHSLGAPSAKTRKIAEDNAGNSNAKISPQPEIQNLPNTAPKATSNGADNIALSKLPAFNAVG